MTINSRDRGVTLPLVALLLPVLILMTAFAVDLGRQRALRRDLQADADVIALDLVRLIVDPTTAPADPETLDALNESRGRNEMAPVTTTDGSSGALVEWGSWVPPLVGDLCPLTIVTEPPSCFHPHVSPFNAVRVTLDGDIDYFFHPGTGHASRSALAEVNPVDDSTHGALLTNEAYFKVGSFLLAVSPTSDTVIGKLIAKVVPGAEVLSYNGLANATVTLGNLLLSLQALQVNNGLDTKISYRQLVHITIDALQRGGGSTAAITLIQSMEPIAPTAPVISLGQVVNAQATGGTPAASATFDVLGLLTGGAFLITGENAVSVPSTNLAIPGLGGVGVSATLIEPPKVGGPHVGDTADTAQLRLGINANIATTTGDSTQNICTLSPAGQTLLNSLVGGILSFAECSPLLGGVVNKAVNLQVTATADLNVASAAAHSTLTAIDCAATPPRITVDPGPTLLELTSAIHLNVSATVGGTSIGNIATIDIPAGALTSSTVPAETFLYPTEFGIPRRTGSTTAGLAGLLRFSPVTLTAAEVSLGPIINPVASVLTTRLNTMLGALDTSVVNPVAQALGAVIGGADLTALSLACIDGSSTNVTTLGHPRLVG